MPFLLLLLAADSPSVTSEKFVVSLRNWMLLKFEMVCERIRSHSLGQAEVYIFRHSFFFNQRTCIHD
jgi:hypothetical protein